MDPKHRTTDNEALTSKVQEALAVYDDYLKQRNQGSSEDVDGDAKENGARRDTDGAEEKA